MDLYKVNNYYATQKGLDLLERYPHFIDYVWFDEHRRETWNASTDKKKIFTKIKTDFGIFVEKKEDNGKELLRLLNLDDELKSRGYQYLHAATPYFGNDNVTLLEYYNMPQINFMNQREIIPSQALDEYCDWNQVDFPCDYFITPDKHIIVIDPHVPTVNDYDSYLKQP